MRDLPWRGALPRRVVSDDLALDLGTARTLVLDPSGAVRVSEPTLAAIDADTGRLLAFGEDALGRASASAGRVNVVRPVRHGQMMDLDLAAELLADVLRRAGASRVSRPRVLVAVAVESTRVQRRALDHALRKAGARAVRFIEAPVAAAIGAGLAIEEPSGSMVAVLGAGRCEVAVLALGGVVTSASLALGGSDLDAAVRTYLSHAYGLHVDHATAEALRERLGSVATGDDGASAQVAGREVATGRLREVVVTRAELRPVLIDGLEPALNAAVRCITSSPPDLANDLLGAGLHLAGGLARLHGLDGRFATTTGLPVHVDDRPQQLVVRGAARCLGSFDALSAAPEVAIRH